MNPSTLVSRNTHLPFTKADDEILMLDMATENYLCLNTTAAAIWEMLEAPQSVSTLCTRLQEKYEVSAAQCEQDVTRLLQDLAAKKLVTLNAG